jgi:hypothetical protein
MNRRQRLSQLSMKIFERALELWDDDKMSFAEARRQAARQVAVVERMKPPSAKPVTPQPAPSTSDTSNIREELFSRILGIKARQQSAEEPRPSIAASIKRVLFNEDEPVSNKPSPPKPAPKSEPVEERSVEAITADALARLYVGGRGVDISGEFPLDPIVDNWRKSIEASKPRKPEGEIPADVVTCPAKLEEYLKANVIAFPKVSLK